MFHSLMRVLLVSAFAAVFALPASADEAHHEDTPETRPETGPEPPRGDMPGGGMMMPGREGMDGMMRMMRDMMSAMPDRGMIDRRRMMGLGPGMMGPGMMRGMMGGMGRGGMGPMVRMPLRAIEHVEGHVAFLKAELEITEAQEKVWDGFAAALRANAEQINAWHAEKARDRGDLRSPVAWLAHREGLLAMEHEVVHRTRPALEALYETLSEDQRRTFAVLTGPRMERSQMGPRRMKGPRMEPRRHGR